MNVGDVAAVAFCGDWWCVPNRGDGNCSGDVDTMLQKHSYVFSNLLNKNQIFMWRFNICEVNP